ncbi:MAG: 50S ribosomal protein L29 [Patescibacteria group bacterium]
MLKTKELKLKSKEDLAKLLKEEQGALTQLRFKLSGSQMKKVHQLKVAKRNIARILTILQEIKN